MEPTMYDVIVVGGGPGGSVAAKRCAQNGFETLLLERKRLPRDKVCSGMVMGPWAHRIIRQEFGEIPGRILVEPFYLAGHMIHVPGVETRFLEGRTPLAWRKDLDGWMNQGAQGAGVAIWDAAKVLRVFQTGDECRVVLLKEEKKWELRARFVIGADGGASAVRKSLFPQLNVRYSLPIRECYRGDLDLAKDRCHWFFPKLRFRPRLCLNHKGDVFLIEGSGIKQLRTEIVHILRKNGVDPGIKPIWRDGCRVPLLHDDLIAGRFRPATGNILLVGDAAGLLFPVTFEGIGAALKSGILAAESIAEAVRQTGPAAEIYLGRLSSVLHTIKRLHDWNQRLEQAAAEGTEKLSEALTQAYRQTFEVV